jgi:pyruvate,water dikinase
VESVIRTLDQVGAGDLDLVGGKGANLGELVSAGVPVPPAFCVTTQAYRRFVDAHHLSAGIAKILATIDYDDPADVERRAASIRALVTAPAVPAGIEQEIVDAYAALEARAGAGVALLGPATAREPGGDGAGADGAEGAQPPGLALRGPQKSRRCDSLRDPAEADRATAREPGGDGAGAEGAEGAQPPGLTVSVRSSATAEDLPGASFAGQQDTYLHISGSSNVVDAVKRCWASLWTGRAIAYRHAQQFEHESVALAVVVQEMFPSDVSGVLFTANPVTSNPFEFFLNASWGLGEAVVSGQVNPDQLIVAKSSRAVVDRQVNDKVVMTAPHESGLGSATVPVPDERRSVQALPDEQVRELCEIGQRIEDHFGFPQDIEWGWAGGRFAILQAREITGTNLDFGHELETWKTPKALADMYDERWVWSRAYSDEVQTGPSTPSFYTYLQLGMTNLKAAALTMTWTDHFGDYSADRFLDFPYFRWYGARAYYNLTFERERIRRFIPPFARDDAALWPFPDHERDAVKNMPFDWNEYMTLLWRLHTERYDVSLLGTTAVVYEGLERWTDAEDVFWATFDVDNASVEELFAGQVASRQGSRFGENVILPFTIYLFTLPAALKTLCERWLGDTDGTTYNRLVAGLKTKTSEENIAVWNLSRRIRSSSHLRDLVETKPGDDVLAALDDHEDGRQFRLDLDAFLATYGHRGGAERDAYHPRWRHRPGLIFQSIRPMLALDDHESPEHHEQRMRDLMLSTKAQCAAQLADQPLGELKAPFFDWFVGLVQDYFYYRDFERFYNDKTMSRSRDLYDAIGRRFVGKGLLSDPDDVFFLGRHEMLAADRGALTTRQIAMRVRARRAVYEKYSHREPPKYIRGWHTFDDEQIDGEGSLRGIAASSGVVTGRARVCRELAEIANVQRGDILVTVATDPGWTTVFSIIGGVVVETGGVVAHAVMISREYGLPCVANLSRACELIPDGALITVDGTAGRVTIHET